MEVHAFRGWRYAQGSTNADSLIAPPYDVLSLAGKEQLLAGSELNIVAVDLPQCPADKAGPDEVYAAAAKLLDQWKRDGVLVQQDTPALYAYQQSYTWAGKDYVRRAMICGVRGTELGADVIPHEKTHSGPKEDRLKLTQQTNMQLSPIFGFYNDPTGKASKLLWSAVGDEPIVQGRLNDVDEKLWAVTDSQVIAQITDILADTPAFIADGHHRYTTALNYRDGLAAAGELDPGHEANFVMFVLVPSDDPGLLVLPTHRLFNGLSGAITAEAVTEVAPQFAWTKHDRSAMSAGDVEAVLAKAGQKVIGLIDAATKDLWIGKLTDRQAMAEAAPEQIQAWRDLDVSILQKLIIEKAFNQFKTGQFGFSYTAKTVEAIESCDSGSVQLAALLVGVPLKAVEQIGQAGAYMPQKSTYFYPKVATGMVLKPLK